MVPPDLLMMAPLLDMVPEFVILPLGELLMVLPSSSMIVPEFDIVPELVIVTID